MGRMLVLRKVGARARLFGSRCVRVGRGSGSPRPEPECRGSVCREECECGGYLPWRRSATTGLERRSGRSGGGSARASGSSPEEASLPRARRARGDRAWMTWPTGASSEAAAGGVARRAGAAGTGGTVGGGPGPVGGRATGRRAAGPGQRSPPRARAGRARGRPAGRGPPHGCRGQRPGPRRGRRRSQRRRPALPPAAARCRRGGVPCSSPTSPRRCRRRRTRPRTSQRPGGSLPDRPGARRARADVAVRARGGDAPQRGGAGERPGPHQARHRRRPHRDGSTRGGLAGPGGPGHPLDRSRAVPRRRSSTSCGERRGRCSSPRPTATRSSRRRRGPTSSTCRCSRSSSPAPRMRWSRGSSMSACAPSSAGFARSWMPRAPAAASSWGGPRQSGDGSGGS